MKPQVSLAGASDSTGKIIAENWWYAGLGISSSFDTPVEISVLLHFRHGTGEVRTPATLLDHHGTPTNSLELGPGKSGEIMICAWRNIATPHIVTKWPLPDEDSAIFSPGKWSCLVRIFVDGSQKSKKVLVANFDQGGIGSFKEKRRFDNLRRLLLD